MHGKTTIKDKKRALEIKFKQELIHLAQNTILGLDVVNLVKRFEFLGPLQPCHKKYKTAV